MGSRLAVLLGEWHDGEAAKRQASQSAFLHKQEPIVADGGLQVPHPQPNWVCDLRNTGGVAGLGSGSWMACAQTEHAQFGL